MIEKERQARRDSRGMWANSYQFVRNSDQVRELLAARGRFILVEGRVHTVAERGGRAYLATSAATGGGISRPRRLRAFCAAMRRQSRSCARSKGAGCACAAGSERRNGPYIEIASLADIEVLEEPSAAGQADAAAMERPPN